MFRNVSNSSSSSRFALRLRTIVCPLPIEIEIDYGSQADRNKTLKEHVLFSIRFGREREEDIRVISRQMSDGKTYRIDRQGNLIN